MRLKMNIRKWIRRIGWLCSVPILLLLVLSALLYVPQIQQWAVRKAASYASEATGLQIGIGKLRLDFPLKLAIHHVTVLTPDTSTAVHPDTLLSLRELKVQVKPLPLLRRQVLVEAVNLRDVQANTKDMIEGMELKGKIGRLYAHADRIHLATEEATLNELKLEDAALTLLLCDSTNEADSTSAPLRWRLNLEKIDLANVAFALQIPADSLRMAAHVSRASLRNGSADLGTMRYEADRFILSNGTVRYDGDNQAAQPGLDPMHIHLSRLYTSLSGINYAGLNMQAKIDSFRVEERSGLIVKELAGELHSDSLRLWTQGLHLDLSDSHLELKAEIPWESFRTPAKDELSINLTASLGKEDLMKITGNLPEDFHKAYPSQPLLLTTGIRGNLDRLTFEPLVAELPEAFKLEAKGSFQHVTDSLRRTGSIQLMAESRKLDFLLTMLPEYTRNFYHLPKIKLEGTADIKPDKYQTELLLREGKGTVHLRAGFDPKRFAYKASLDVDSLEPIHFMPLDSLYRLTASFEAQGKGNDPFSPRTWAHVKGTVSNIQYGNRSLANINLEGSLEKQLLKMDLLSHYPLAEMDLSLHATLKKEEVEAMLIADVEKLDLYGLHLLPTPIATSFQLFAEAKSDLKEKNLLDITLGNWELQTEKNTFHPKTLTLHARSDTDTTRLSFHAGDLGIMLTGNACVHELAEKLTRVSNDANRQLEQDSTLNINLLRPLLPELALEVKAGRDNPVYNLLQSYYIDFKQLNLTASTSPEAGLRMDAEMTDLARDTILIDTLRATLYQDTAALRYEAKAIKKRYRQQAPFTAGIDGSLSYGKGDARLYLLNGKGETGLLLGLQAEKATSGFRLSLFPETPIIAFRPFHLNPGNYLIYRNEKEIEADLRLTGTDNASLWIHSEPGEIENQNEVHAELNQFDLGVISNAFSYLPKMQGLLNADLKYTPSDSAFLVVADAGVDNFYYENGRVGELMFNAVYLPLEQGNHQVDMHLFRDQQEISAITALYQQATDEEDRISGNILFNHLPLAMLNPFIPDSMARLRGDLDGEMAISGSTARPLANGHLLLDTASVYVGAAGSTFRFDTTRIRIEDNRIRFRNYNFYAYGKNPLTLNGSIDLSDLSKMTADLRLTASDLQLLNVRRNRESLVYGKLFVNLNSTLRGALDALVMRGDLQMLGGTNLTYVMQDSPLTVQDRLSDMVTFTSFADTLRHRTVRKPPLPLGGMDMLMTIRIDPAVQVNVDLTPDQSSHVNLEGGGDLSFQYTPQGDMVLNGRYTLSGGTVKYSLPVIPLKEFNIAEDSYVEWTGNPMDPMLNLSATERIRTSVSLEGQAPRPVNFDVGIELKQRLENLALNFTLDAPEDLTMQEELTAKGNEERAKLAVSMLVTGMYLGGGNTGKVNLNMGDALNSFLQSEINNIAGSALKTVDISFDMESYDEDGAEGGSTRTDYSFRFAKRFYNDRIRVVLGGRISTGENINNGQAQPFIDNVSVEYRLDNSGSRYVRLFHNKNYESLLEGEITETGAGVILRKKMMHLRELFNFKKKKVQPIKEEKDEATK